MRPITDFLVEFPRAVLPPSLMVAPHGPGAAAVPAETEGLERAIDEARETGMLEARAAAEDEFAARVAALRDSHADELAAARARWAATEGAALAEALRRGLAQIEENIARSLATVMLPMLDAAVRARIGGEASAAVAQMLAGGQGGVIEVRGAADLLGPVRAAFEDNAAVVVTDADAPEVSIRSGDTEVTSQIEAWSTRLHAALEIAS